MRRASSLVVAWIVSSGSLLALVFAGVATADGGGARHGGITEEVACSNCHTPEGWSLPGSGSGEGGFDHSSTGFPLSGRHQSVGCVGCHAPGRRVSRECSSCHQDAHLGRLSLACDECHSARRWSDTRAIALHRTTRLPLTGMHALVDCTECHGRIAQRQWTSTPADCIACHLDDYRSPDVHPNHYGGTGNPPFPRECETCHRPGGWTPALIDPSTLPRTAGLRAAPRDHELRFPIAHGPHRGASCDSCHVSPELPRAIRCNGCHAHSDVRLRRQHRGVPISSSGASCLSCHPAGSAPR